MAVQVEQLITEHLDLWTQAQTAKSTSGRGSNNKIELTGIKKLRELILELAVRGKLVPQDPNDEPASELLKRITAEKEALIKAGKLKKQKPLPPISDEEKPFELTVGWEWARLGYAATYGSSGKAETKDADENTWVLELEDIEKETSRLIQKVRFSEREFKSTKSQFNIGDVLYGKLRPYLDKVIVADEPGVCTTEIIPISCYGGFSPYYLRWMLKTPRFIKYADESTHGMSMPRLGTDKGELALVAVAPVREQTRIVAKVDELMALCDQLEQRSYRQLDAHNQLVDALLPTLTQSQNADELASNWQRLVAHFDTLFTTEYSIDALKQTILQLAVMGKLVKQDPNDEPASELLKRISAEKDALIKACKINKQKPLPPISDDEKPFVLPEGWEFSRFGSIYALEYGNNLPQPKRSETGEFAVYGSNGIVGTHSECCVFEPCIVVGRKGSAGALNLSTDSGCWVTDVAYSVVPPKFLNLNFVFKQFHTLGLDALGKGIKPGLNRDEAYALIVAVPPLKEQQRIVEKVDELMSFCESLKTKIEIARAIQLMLADTLIKSLIGHHHSVVSINNTVENSMKITTNLILVNTETCPSDAILAEIIKSEGGEVDAKKVWMLSKLDLPSFYKQLKNEILAGYIKKPSAATF